ncbi:peptidoglycan-binding domain-containing protein [Geomicrobium sp. JCM 19037]|uniref:peptidoglycan-binding domain-containing protein n=1 Tax=Geomicrobium sp. JCM 19037 TaxID=1460634 RepID=UPI0006932614
MKDLGYYSHAVTGTFGPITERAVRDFQRNNRIGVDGLVGPQTTARSLTVRSEQGKAQVRAQARRQRHLMPFFAKAHKDKQ